MSDIRNLSGISVDTGVGAPISEVSDAGEVPEKDQLAFHDALAKREKPHESRSPETRRAIKRSLERFQASSETEEGSGSSESEIADAGRGDSTRLKTGRPAGTAAGDGPAPARGARKAADAGGEDPVAARDRSRRTASSSPPVGDGGSRGATTSSWPPAKPGPADADRKPAGAGSAVEAARTTPTTGADDAHDPDIAAIDMTGVAASAGIAELEHTSAPEGVQAPVGRAAELAEQVADRILVSMPDSNAPGEVRISLRQSILDGSDVRIFHEEGDLKVVFVAATESAQRFLAHNREQFQQTLGERLQDQRVHVEVEASSRGAASGEDHQGRSRQQYVRQDDSSDAR